MPKIKPKVNNKVAILTYCTRDERAALKKMAEKQGRSLSNMMLWSAKRANVAAPSDENE